MSDYAGAIGSVLSIVGMATGQVWLTGIGMAVSAWGASQQVIPGPKIGDVQRQTSQEGGFRPIVYGRSHPIAGNIIADGGPVIVTKRERQGKGGPKVESESAFRTYAVGFCEGEATLLQAWRNGIRVYDAEDPGMAAENAKFLEYATWYTGAYDQSASPDLEEIYGVGQAPYFRGTAYLSLHNEDVTDQRGAWSQWQVRVFRSAAKSYTTPPYPVTDTGSIQTTSAFNRGSVISEPVELMGLSVRPLGGQVRDLIQNLFAGYEELALSNVTPLGGQINSIVKNYSAPAEELQIAALAPLGGDVYNTVLPYTNYKPEEIDISLKPLGGEVT